ncbi:MAG: LytTR family transcriptional regulator [Chitinophagaceae bacterium]|nr:LytTR family transcriptional regulator [Chitinophagaceae bacterium]
MKSILIPTNKGTKTVSEEHIIRIEASSNYCKIYFSNQKPLVVSKVLHWFQDILTQDIFCRIHRTHIVNRMYVTEIIESSLLKLSNGDLVQISRRRKNHTGQLLNQRA